MRGRTISTCALALALVVVLALPASAISFGRTRRASTRYSWNPGKSLVATSTKLLTIYASDCPAPSFQCATDRGPHMGVFVRRSPAGAVQPDWTKPRRLSPSTVHAERPSIASDGSTLVASYVTQRRYLHHHASDPRVLWVRVSTSRGKSWRSPVRLSSRTARVDYPRVAVASGRLYVVWTGASSGEIRLATSDDLGHHWKTTTIAHTTSKPFGTAQGFAGLPDVGASGPNVAIAWFANNDGEQDAIVSATGGDDAGTATPIQLTAHSPNRGPQFPAVGGADDPADPRVAIGYTTSAGVEVVTFDGVTVSTPSKVFTWNATVGGAHYVGGYGPAVQPFGTAGIAVAVAGCRPNRLGNAPCAPLAAGARIDVLYRESPDGGASWNLPHRLTNAAKEPFRINDEPSIARTGPRVRVSFDRYERTFHRYDVALRTSS